MHTIILEKGDLINIQTGFCLKPGSILPEEMRGFWEFIGYLRFKYDPKSNAKGYSRIRELDNLLVFKSVIDTEGKTFQYAAGRVFCRTICTNRVRIDLEIDLIAYAHSFEGVIAALSDCELH